MSSCYTRLDHLSAFASAMADNGLRCSDQIIDDGNITRLVSPERERLLDVLEDREKLPVRVQDFIRGFKTLDTGDKLAIIVALANLADEKARTRRASNRTSTHVLKKGRCK